MKLGDQIAEILEQIKRGDVQNIDTEKARRLFNQADEVVQKASGWMTDADDDPHFSKMYARLAEFMQGKAGLRIANPPLLYDGEYWHLVGTDDTDTMQVGINASTGKLQAGGTALTVDENGITIKADGTDSYLRFTNNSDVEIFKIFHDNYNLQFDLSGDLENKGFTFNDGGIIIGKQSTASFADPFVHFHIDYSRVGQMFWDESHDNLVLVNEVANGGNGGTVFSNVPQSASDNMYWTFWDGRQSQAPFWWRTDGGMRMRTVSSAPTDPPSNSVLIYAYSDGAGTDELRWKYNDGSTMTTGVLADLSP